MLSIFNVSMERFFCNKLLPLKIDNNNNGEPYESIDRDELIYSPECITPKLEAAYLRFCRFSRTLAIRNFDEYITSVDVKDLCGDLLVTDALIVLKQFNYNVVDAVYYLQSNDLRHAWDDGRLDKKKLRIFENYVSQYGFNSSITKVIGFENKRRNIYGKEINRTSYAYLFNYYQSWKRTHDGLNIMEQYYHDESKFEDVPILCPYCEKDEFHVGKTNKIMCQKCYEFFDIVDAVRSVSINESITLAPVVFKWNQVKCYEQIVLEKPQSGRKRTRSVTTTTEYGWNDECANKCFTLLSALKMKNSEEDNESLDRDELIYSPGCITPKLEAAYLRFCRFSRTLAIRNFEEYITSVDVKDLCGDLLVTDALIILKQFNYNVVDAVYYLQSNDLRHAWADGRLDKEKRRIFENYVSQYGFNSSITKVIGFENKRRDVSSKEINRGSYTYLFNYYQSWKRTHDGSNIMEKFYRSGQKVIENVTGKEICTESKFKDIPILCQYCEKDEFRVGKTNKIMCKKCYEFFNIVDAVRSVSINESITLAPIVFKWNRVECYEPFVPRKLRKYRKRRTRSVTTSNEYFWSNAQAKKFGKLVTTIKKKRQRVENSRSNHF